MAAIGRRQTAEEAAQVAGRLRGIRRVPALGLAILDDRPGGGQIVFVEEHTDAHVEQVAQRGASVGGLCDLGDPVRDRLRRVEHPLVGELTRDDPEHGLRDRHQDVRRVRRHAVGVVLEHDPAMLKDHQCIGIGGVQERREIDAVGLRRRQDPHAVRIVGNVGRRYDLAYMMECPSIPGRTSPVGQRHLGIFGGGKALHQRFRGHGARLLRKMRQVRDGARLHWNTAAAPGGAGRAFVGRRSDVPPAAWERAGSWSDARARPGAVLRRCPDGSPVRPRRPRFLRT